MAGQPVPATSTANTVESMAQALVTAISRELSAGHTQNNVSAPVRPPQRASSNTFTPSIT
ncbi:hypothetical protein PO909_016579, partial [Leuciscus waleckii]